MNATVDNVVANVARIRPDTRLRPGFRSRIFIGRLLDSGYGEAITRLDPDGIRDDAWPPSVLVPVWYSAYFAERWRVGLDPMPPRPPLGLLLTTWARMAIRNVARPWVQS